MVGDGGVEGTGGVLCARVDTLAKQAIAKSINRFLILMDRKPPDRIFQFHVGDARKFQKAEGGRRKAVNSKKVSGFCCLPPSVFCSTLCGTARAHRLVRRRVCLPNVPGRDARRFQRRRGSDEHRLFPEKARALCPTRSPQLSARVG